MPVARLRSSASVTPSICTALRFSKSQQRIGGNSAFGCNKSLSSQRAAPLVQGHPLDMTLPTLVAFDLDATLWTPEMYELSGPPFKVDKRNLEFLVDGSGERIRLMGTSRQILSELATAPRWQGTQVAYVSRTEYPQWAATCLRLFHVAEGISMHEVGQQQEIYPGGKKTHFRRIHERTGIPFEEMLFFDNEAWNVTDVAPLGVCCVYTPRGMTAEAWAEGLAAFEAATQSRAVGKAPQLVVGNLRRRGF